MTRTLVGAKYVSQDLTPNDSALLTHFGQAPLEDGADKQVK